MNESYVKVIERKFLLCDSISVDSLDDGHKKILPTIGSSIFTPPKTYAFGNFCKDFHKGTIVNFTPQCFELNELNEFDEL